MNLRQPNATTRALSWLALLVAAGGAGNAQAQFGFDAAANSIWRRLPQQSVAASTRRLPPVGEYGDVRQTGVWMPQADSAPQLNPAANGLPPMDFSDPTPRPGIEELSPFTTAELWAAPFELISPAPPVAADGGRHSPRNYTPAVATIPLGVAAQESPFEAFDWYHFGVMGRSYYGNDQRIEWSGVEATLAVEGVLAGGVRRDNGLLETGGEIELYLNQPFDRNILVDTAERQSYVGNWNVDPVEISQLYLTGRRGDWLLAVGKMPTPFGRTYFPLYLNDRSDAPFIRSESILWRETALLFQFDPDNWVFTAAMVNGGDGRDANSSKGLIARVAFDSPTFALGGSIKTHDGVGSEGQKQFSDHVGIDLMMRRGRLTFSSEVIYDQYGFRRPFNPQNITWGRSIYFRDQNVGWHEPITGVGYYANLGYEGDRWSAMLNYGEFYPRQIGDPRHDVSTKRGIIKLIRHHLNADFYVMLMLENDVQQAQDNRLRKGANFLTGFQLSL